MLILGHLWDYPATPRRPARFKHPKTRSEYEPMELLMVFPLCSGRRAGIWGGCAGLRTFPYKKTVAENYSGRFAARGRRRAQIDAPNL